VNLRASAEIEAARLAGARALAHEGDAALLARLEADGPWVLVARRSGLRRQLEGRVLCIWQVACEDAAGLVMESRLMAVAVRLSARAAPRTRVWRQVCLREIEGRLRARIDAEARTSSAAAVEAARSFLAARLAREEAMAGKTRETHPAADAFQPGLFDGRAARRHREASDAGADARLDAANRIAALQRSAALVVRPDRLLFVVVP